MKNAANIDTSKADIQRSSLAYATAYLQSLLSYSPFPKGYIAFGSSKLIKFNAKKTDEVG